MPKRVTQSKGKVSVAKTTQSFSSLPKEVQQRVAKTIIGSLRRTGYFGRGFYKSVHGPDQLNRRWTNAETGGEEFALPADERNRLIALARNAARNSEHLEGVLHQLEINVIGVDGGKAIFNFGKGYEKAEAIIREAFADWASEAEYFDDASLQDCLRMILRGQLIGGDLVIVFDWDITKESTGQVIQFEADCIGNLKGFDKLFPGYTQHQGIIKNGNGKTIGAVVSWSQRGQTEYADKDEQGRLAAWPLIRPEGVKWKDSPFIIFRGLERPNQVRGVSRLWPALSTIVDVSDLQGFELQAAKDGAQKIGTITQTEENTEGEIAGELDPEMNQIAATAEDYESAVQAAREAAMNSQEELSLQNLKGAGAIWDCLPPGCKYELLDTKHPNDKLVEFSNWLSCGAAFSAGLASIHATGKADKSYSAAMAEMLMSSIEFMDSWHKLEKGFLDWVISNWSRMAQAQGIIPQDSELPPSWRRKCVNWIRPRRKAINEVDGQNACNLGLNNGTKLYRDELGADWRNHILQLKEEVDYFQELGLVHPMFKTVSGGIVTADDTKKGNKDE